MQNKRYLARIRELEHRIEELTTLNKDEAANNDAARREIDALKKRLTDAHDKVRDLTNAIRELEHLKDALDSETSRRRDLEDENNRLLNELERLRREHAKEMTSMRRCVGCYWMPLAVSFDGILFFLFQQILGGNEGQL